MDCGTTSSLHVHVQTFGLCFITFPVPLRTGVRPTQKFIRKWRHNVLDVLVENWSYASACKLIQFSYFTEI